MTPDRPAAATETLQAEPILQSGLRDDVRVAANRLPGVAPLDPGDWLVVDDAYEPQIALREALIARRREEVLALEPGAIDAAAELLEMVLDELRARPDFEVEAHRVLRPGAGPAGVDRGDPLGTLGRLVQEDFCLLERRGTEHVMTGAVLCFPSRWMLAQKIGRPLMAIHAPVAPYDADLGRRVQRLFDGVRVGRPLWRANAVRHHDPTLFQPVPEYAEGGRDSAAAPWLRSERQCIVRLPRTNAVVFSIHTSVVRAADIADCPPPRG